MKQTSLNIITYQQYFTENSTLYGFFSGCVSLVNCVVKQFFSFSLTVHKYRFQCCVVITLFLCQACCSISLYALTLHVAYHVQIENANGVVGYRRLHTNLRVNHRLPVSRQVKMILRSTMLTFFSERNGIFTRRCVAFRFTSIQIDLSRYLMQRQNLLLESSFRPPNDIPYSDVFVRIMVLSKSICP